MILFRGVIRILNSTETRVASRRRRLGGSHEGSRRGRDVNITSTAVGCTSVPPLPACMRAWVLACVSDGACEWESIGVQERVKGMRESKSVLMNSNAHIHVRFVWPARRGVKGDRVAMLLVVLKKSDDAESRSALRRRPNAVWSSFLRSLLPRSTERLVLDTHDGLNPELRDAVLLVTHRLVSSRPGLAADRRIREMS